MEETGRAASDGGARRVRVPWFPIYGELRHLLRIWPGFTRSNVTGLHKRLAELRGSPQNPVDWQDPDSWIRAKLKGEDLKLALAIWTGSDKSVNPRYTSGAWILSQKYRLLADGSDGNLRLTERGRDFIDHEFGEAEAYLDLQEGAIELLVILADSGPAQRGALVDAWADFLKRRSGFRSRSTIRDTLSSRLRNLLARRLINRDRLKYTVTETGLQYLERVAPPSPGDELQAIRNMTRKRGATVREDLHKHLLQMDPTAFEHLVARVLEAMDYENVKVTGQSGDGGVDVVAEIELGVTSVREVVQVKRHKRTIQAKDVAALRGSLFKFGAVRGTIVTTSGFARGAKKDAFAQGAAPITLIDGKKLIDLLIKHEIGVRKHEIEVLSVDWEGLADVEELGGG
ncbi:MAG: restriction endonuclease [Gemmatimonadetes bacterium]|nr:restriction endonuclease [Gemmatimonadota bacterium]